MMGSMTLKGEGKGPLPPLLQQYVELRDQYPEYLLLFQVGDFYECFGEDAERLARALGLVLTHKTSKDFTTPMAGIPVRSADTYIERLLAQGVRVALADQVEDPQAAEGLVRREVTQLITPGTVTEENLLRPDANYLAALATGDGYGLALIDVSTGEFRGTHLYSRTALYDELVRYRPAEVLLAPELYEHPEFGEELRRRFPVMLAQARFDVEEARRTLTAHFGVPPQGVDTPALLRAAGAVLAYALETQQGRLAQVTRFLRYDPGAYMQLDGVALATLEVFEAQFGGGEERTLFGVLNQTRTAPGRRLLREWLRHPLLDRNLIEARLEAVEAFVRDAVLRRAVRRALYKVHDLERLAGRLASHRASARDLAALARSLRLVPALRAELEGCEEDALLALAERLDGMAEVRERIEAALVEDPPQKLTEGGLIKDGYDAELDRLRGAAEAGRAWIAALEAKERERTGIPTLKVGFNGVFGYYLEVTRPYYAQVPEDYRAVQTLKDRQRYTRPDLREKEREILRAEEAARKREYAVFSELREALVPYAERVRDLAAALAELDVYAALAEVAAQYNYTRPRFSEDGVFRVRQGRHAVVERHGAFIPNDLELSPQQRLVILTGPNMSGKSTYLRQNALIVLLAQIGSFVPAEEAVLPVVDRIYTRIGAADDIAGGRSTFMVEMEELARILQGATERSLVLLDEVGRGTSTYDGLSLAWAAAEYLHDTVRAYTLFATHYFELTALPQRLPAARNFHVAAKEEAGGLVFYHQVLPGPASKSYGLEVARLAGVPPEVVTRAQQLLAGLEARGGDAAAEVVEALLSVDLSRLSPLEALMLLHRIQERLRGVAVNEG
ncbi:DNA mismatch repair protein mutS [Marinithermus hydrothermalis DSM 14884]|uniref:DNA mismatch repair protein MutS n=2 Tax=Marinithermus TaxID=186191 RepID=F2NPE3_MARHT|nr:DNA mismatch repair protein mutS [Marinithermus hydrothermalis DSM 14884]